MSTPFKLKVANIVVWLMTTMVLLLLSGNVLATTLIINESFIGRDDSKIYSRQICPNGKSDISEHRQLVMAHGLTYSSHEFDVNVGDYSLARYFAKQGFCVWLFDVTGYGQSSRPDDGLSINTDTAVKDLTAVVAHVRRQTKVAQVSLLGWSWGTVVAARFAAVKQQWVKNLVLYAPIYWRLGSKQTLPTWHKNTWAHAASDFQQTDAGQINYDIVDKVVANQFLANCWRYDGDTSPNGGRKDLLDGNAKYMFDLAHISQPVLLIGGDKDPLLNWPQLHTGFSKIAQRSHNKLVKLAGGSHILMLEKAQYRPFRSQVLEFLNQTQ